LWGIAGDSCQGLAVHKAMFANIVDTFAKQYLGERGSVTKGVIADCGECVVCC
jgi:hypothetical protein